jgi:uncharacterized protein
MKRWLKRIGVAAIVLLLGGYIAAGAAIYTQQRGMLFRPNPERIAPASVGLPKADEIFLAVPGGDRVLAWNLPAADPGKPVILYLHGNAGNLARRATRFQQLTQRGAGLLALSWRGYGGSGGAPNEAAFREDVAAAFAHLARLGIGPERIVIFGESLGSGVAVMEAAARPVRGLVLDSPYESIARIAEERFWWLPVNALMKDPFRAIDAAPRVRAPTLMTACTDDWLTPYAGALRLKEKLGGPKRLITFDRRCHIPAMAGAPEQILAFLENPAGL